MTKQEHLENMKPKIICRLIAENAKSLNDNELVRCLQDCVAGEGGINVARELRDTGMITGNDLRTGGETS